MIINIPQLWIIAAALFAILARLYKDDDNISFIFFSIVAAGYMIVFLIEILTGK